MNRSNVSRMLLATDFSDSALLAHDYAAQLASAFGASVDILHVTDRRPEMRAAELLNEEGQVQSQLQSVEKMLRNHGVPVTIRRITGDPSAEIVAVGRQVDADVIAMGLQGYTHVPYGLIGSTVDSVTKAGICPVLTVPLPHKEASPCVLAPRGPASIRRILVAVDFSSPSIDALECAVHFARALRAELMLVHVVEPAHSDWDHSQTEEDAQNRTSWEARLKELVDEAKALGLLATYDIRGGVPADSILAGALQHRCDLIVMGTHGRQGRDREKVGSVAEGVLKQATCPVVTVKNPKFLSGGRRSVSTALVRQEQRREATD
jgi:nucleotide-binding universal stress UspA family protein